jgi:hypothetical protein
MDGYWILSLNLSSAILSVIFLKQPPTSAKRPPGSRGKAKVIIVEESKGEGKQETIEKTAVLKRDK